MYVVEHTQIAGHFSDSGSTVGMCASGEMTFDLDIGHACSWQM